MATEQPSERDPSWDRQQLQRSIGIRQAAMAASVDRLQKMSRLNQRLVRKTQDGTLGKQTVEPEDVSDDMIHVGDLTLNLGTEGSAGQPQAAPAAPLTARLQPAAPAQGETKQTTGPLSGLQKGMMAAALASGLLGAGGIGTVIGSKLNQPAPAANQPAGPDENTLYELRLVE